MSSAGRARRPRGAARNLGFGLAVAVLVLWLAEVGLRLGGVQPAYRADDVGGWRMQPKVDAQPITGHEGTRFVLTTNDDGLRTRARRTPAPGVRRVVLMGDSTVFGWGVDDGDTVADALAEGLGPGFDVVNAGQPGYSTTQMEALYSRVVHAYAGDLVVVFVPMHDDNRVLVSDREHLEGGRGTAAVRVLLADHSRLYQLLRGVLFTHSRTAALVPGRDESAEPRVPRVSDTERDENFDRIRAALAASGGRLAIGHLPFLADLSGEARTERYSVPWARAYAERTGTPIVDLRACCTTPDAAALVLPQDPGHLASEGNRRVGAAAVEPIRALLGP